MHPRPYNLKDLLLLNLDKHNQAILQCLKANSRMSWQQIGKVVHLSGQAVAARVQQLQDQGHISGFTIRQDQLPLHFITVFMQSASFDAFERFVSAEPGVQAAHKVSGEGCYQLVFLAADAQALPAFLSGLEQFATYKILSTVRRIK